MSQREIDENRPSLLQRIAPIGGLIYGLAVLVSFFTSSDYEDNAASVQQYAADSQPELWYTGILGLSTPLLVGAFVAALAALLAPAASFYRNLVLVGGTTFIALMTVGLTVWSAPILETDISESTATTYLALDDFGWVLLGSAGVGMGVLMVGASLAAMRLGMVPAWLGWLGVVLGVVSFASVAAVGLFAWTAWLIVASLLLVLRPNRAAGTA